MGDGVGVVEEMDQTFRVFLPDVRVGGLDGYTVEPPDVVAAERNPMTVVLRPVQRHGRCCRGCADSGCIGVMMLACPDIWLLMHDDVFFKIRVLERP